MYKVSIYQKEVTNPALVLKTESRNLARSAYLLCRENGVRATVVREVEPVEVKFKGVSS